MKKFFFCVIMSIFCGLGVCSEAADVSDWAKFNRYAKENAMLKQNPEVVFMGNSITDFWPVKSPQFWADHPGYVGRGISGQTTCEMLVRFRRDVIDLHPRVVVILAGINDIAQNNGPISLDNVFGNIQSMVELARANRIKVALCSVLPCSSFPWRPAIKPAAQVRNLNARISNYVKTLHADDVVYVDYYSAMANKNGGLDSSLSDDGCHPTANGYAIMQQVVTPVLNRLLK
ncbi:MAG: GDSL-type esterase/lipase family protein [Muribaculaceae bacterium]